MDRSVIDQFRLDGQVALITGAGSGIGEAYAQAMAEAGADVACVDIDVFRAKQIADEKYGSWGRGRLLSLLT